MVREINNGGVKLNATVQSDKATRNNAKAPESTPQAAATPRPATDSVSLSNSAQALQSVVDQLKQLPDVNEKRVAEIRAALASGEYKVDDLVLADKLLAADDLLK
ncbi:MAG: flagellar biosynthesis anti-sigma factor FlgM [Spongiibacteraceae bacterium]|jgi:negative regulator of flagellin synthesis FlgM|nr:flagellar biosynthesis anti-sigma factor FlgM [Spongiibacteraceae bacterium]